MIYIVSTFVQRDDLLDDSGLASLLTSLEEVQVESMGCLCILNGGMSESTFDMNCLIKHSLTHIDDETDVKNFIYMIEFPLYHLYSINIIGNDDITCFWVPCLREGGPEFNFILSKSFR